MKQQKHRQQRNDGHEEETGGHITEELRLRRSAGNQQEKSGMAEVEKVDCATKVGGQLCNIKAVKLNGCVCTRCWPDMQTYSCSPEYSEQTKTALFHKFLGCWADYVVTNWELTLRSRHITEEIMDSLGLTGVEKPHAEHLLLFSMATPVSL